MPGRPAVAAAPSSCGAHRVAVCATRAELARACRRAGAAPRQRGCHTDAGVLRFSRSCVTGRRRIVGAAPMDVADVAALERGADAMWRACRAHPQLRVLVWLAVFGMARGCFRDDRRSSDGRAALVATTERAPAVHRRGHHSAAVRVGCHEAVRCRRARAVSACSRHSIRSRARLRSATMRLSLVSPASCRRCSPRRQCPDSEPTRQPVRVVLNARFRLPAGTICARSQRIRRRRLDSGLRRWRCRLAAKAGRSKVGRWCSAPAQRSQREFDVPLDAEFVGFRATRQVEEAIAELRLSPRDVVESRQAIRRRDGAVGRSLRARAHVLSRQLCVSRSGRLLGARPRQRCG